ncbi:MAG: hypothetical protein AB7V50_04725 [Vampirovibrionia bacterium]
MSKIKFFLSLLIIIAVAILCVPQVNAADQTPDEVEFKLRKEEVAFIPYRELDRFLTKNTKLVYMSYKELAELINQKSQIRPLAPVNHVIKDLSLSGTVSNDHISFEALYKIEVLNKQWSYIPVLSTSVGLKSAEYDGKSAPISTDGSSFRILTDQIGEHTLKLKYDVKINETGNTKSFQFNMPTLPITRLAIVVPEVPVKLNIQNASGVRSEVKDKKTITYANLIGQGNVQVDWKSNLIKLAKAEAPKVIQEDSKLPSKVIANVETLISVDEGIMQGFSTYRCQIFHKPVEKLTLAIPDNVEIISVTSPSDIVRKGPPVVTDVNGKKPGRLLTVFFNSKIKDHAVFNVVFEKTFENKKVQEDVPGVYLVGKEINKTDGYIAIQSLGNIEIKQIETKNISRTPEEQLPVTLENDATNPILLAYQYVITNIKEEYELKLEIIPSEDASVQVAMIDSASIDSILSSNGVLTTKADYTLRNMSEQYFRFNLPEGAEILVALIDGRPVQIEKESEIDETIPAGKDKPEIKEDKFPKYMINIKNHQDERPFNISIMYKQDKKFNFLTRILNVYDLQAPYVSDIPTLTLSWSIYIPDGMKYWFNTALNRGSTNYASYIQSSSWGDVGRSTSVSSFSAPVQSQVMNVAPPGYAVDSDKVAGVLPPEFSMPPTKGLTRIAFADYLLMDDVTSKASDAMQNVAGKFININVIGITNIMSLLIFLVMLYAGWLISDKSRMLLNNTDSVKERAAFFIPVAIVLYVIGLILGFMTIWAPVIIAIIVYIVYRLLIQFKR